MVLKVQDTGIFFSSLVLHTARVTVTTANGAQLAFGIHYQIWQICWCPVLFTDKSRFTLSTRERGERIWRRCGKRYAPCNIIQHGLV